MMLVVLVRCSPNFQLQTGTRTRQHNCYMCGCLSTRIGSVWIQHVHCGLCVPYLSYY